MKAALLYARRGWRVVPLHSGPPCSCVKGSACTSAGKHPRLREWAAAASADEATVRSWWAQWPAANIGIATGQDSGVFVLDVDGPVGAASLARLTSARGELPPTTQAETGRGGQHFYFRAPGRPVPNSAGKLAPGLDIRGDGGQVVAPPSRTVGAYRWIVPPWETAPADAPAWLLEMIETAPAAALRPAAPAFPPASPAVLDAARAALDNHGPAVSGEGGDQHTFVAAALLTHDFALSEREAWPLLVEWNATCEPPWSDEELRAKLRGGAKYGTGELGAKRPGDALERLRRMVAEWRAAGQTEAAMLGLVAQARELVGRSTLDPAARALLVRELRTATGLSEAALALPKGKSAPKEERPGEIRVTTHLAEMADAALRAISSRVFVRHGQLCEVVPGGRTWIHDLDPSGLLDLMSRTSRWVREEEHGLVPQLPPPVVASVLHARRIHPGVRELDAVTTAPVLLPDGSVLQGRGYNASARLYLEPSVSVDVPDEPSIDDARAAVALFEELLADFRFVTPADFSAWLAALLSPLVKAATGNAPAPLLIVSAPMQGAGKSLLTDVLSLIVTGATSEIRPYDPSNIGEWQKRMTSFVRSGVPINVFDNVNGHIGDETLDRVLTGTVLADRVLGASDAPAVPIVGTWIATGNNLEPTGDTVRRSMMARLDVHEDRPQERDGFLVADLPAHVLARRGELLGAALTLLRAYHVAGRPGTVRPWGSFGPWSALVRGALVWAGCADPYETQARLAASAHEGDFAAHDFWIDAIRATDGVPENIALAANQRGAARVLGLRSEVTVHSLRALLRRWIDRPRLGRRIRKMEEPTRYRVEGAGS